MRLHPVALALATMAFSSIAMPLSAAESPSMLLAGVERGQSELSRYLVSEKFDGVRAYWDGKILRTRQGTTLNAPRWFTEGFPARALDGELWIGRGQFDQLSATVRRQLPDESEWRQVRYLVFELPEAAGSFRERVQVMKDLVAAAGVPWLQVVEQLEVADRKALLLRLDEVIQAGGEGLMLHRADAPYVTGRGDVLLKMKRWNDAEATVIGHRPGRGKYQGMLGALRLRTAEGIEFSLGTGLSEAIRRSPPSVGMIVTYRYRELTSSGRPRFASFHRVQEF